MSINRGSVIVLLAFFVLMFNTSASAQNIAGGISSGISVLPGPIIITPNRLNPQQYDLRLLVPTPLLSPALPAPTPQLSRTVIYQNKSGEIKMITVPPSPPKVQNEKIDAELVDCEKICADECKEDRECLTICMKACEE